MAIEADAYFAAGDLVSWARGLDKMGEVMKPRRERVYVLPGNHESASDIAEILRALRFRRFPRRDGRDRRRPFRRPGLLDRDALRHPRRIWRR